MKIMLYTGAGIGGLIGGVIGGHWGGPFGFAAISLGAIGTLVGCYAGYLVGKAIGE